MSQRFPFSQVDAFASQPFSGNPAAVIQLTDWPSDTVLQAIAAENNLAETAFLIPASGDNDADYHLRWFTPAMEVALCGHATLAAGHTLLSAEAERTSVRFKTGKAGILEVTRDTQWGYALDLPAWKPSPAPLPDIAAAMRSAPMETLWRQGGYAVMVYANESVVRALDPDYRLLGAMGDILFIATAPGSGEFDVISRVFAPGAGVDEDPVTGSAHCILTPYWTERLGQPSFRAYQASQRGGEVSCRLDGDRAILGGQCITVIDGWFTLP